MADTHRTLDAFLNASTGLFKDNTAGDISAQDLRDFVLSSYILDTVENAITGAATAVIDTMNVCSGTTADYTVTLPAASGNSGKLLGIRISTACTKLITIDGNSSETIDGATTRIMWAGESAILLCDGSNWFKIAGKSIPMSCQLGRVTGISGDISNGALTLIPLNVSEVDNTGVMGDTTNGWIVIKRPGRYDAAGYLTFAATNGTDQVGSAASNIFGRIYKGDSVILGGKSVYYNSTGWFPDPNPVVVGVSLAAADTVRLYGYQNTGGSLDIYSDGSTAGLVYLTVTEVITW